jgi:hypothetical protein
MAGHFHFRQISGKTGSIRRWPAFIPQVE